MAAQSVKKAKKTKKQRKHGRNLKDCQAYRARGQREKNKAIRLKRHLKKFPGDATAAGALAGIEGPRKGAF